MRTLRVALLALAFVFASCLTGLAQNPRPSSSGKAALVDVPMLFSGAMPAVEVMVNGQGPYLFAIDTGGQGMARADSSLVKKLELKVVDRVQTSDGSGRNTRTLDVVQLDSIRLDGVEFKDVRAATRDYNLSPNMPGIDGILGFNLFADYLLTLDFPAKRVRLERGELPKADGQSVLSFGSTRGGTPLIELSVGSHKINAHLDSGNTVGGFILPTALVSKLEFASTPVTVGRARTVSNEVEIKEARLKDKIRFGSFEFTEPTIVFPAVSDDANIGAKVLGEFKLTFDQKNKRLSLERREQSKSAGLTQAAGQTAGNDSSKLKDYAGRYGERQVSLEDGTLFIQRQGGQKLKMVSASGDEFTLERVPTARIKFIRADNQAVTEIHILNMAGEWEKVKKEQP
jgi:hypothetical protein